MRGWWLAAALVVLAPAICCGAQECPRSGDGAASAVRTLTGRLVLHNGLRRWWGLQVSQAVCGAGEIQVIVNSGDDAEDRRQANELDTLRGCDVEITGPLNVPGTGYFSAPLYQTRYDVKAEPGCIRQPLFPEYTGSLPAGNLRRYDVRISLDYVPGDHPPAFVITGNGRRLSPWQAYASYRLTGERVMYAECGRGFAATRFSGGSAAHPWLVDGTVGLDPERAAAAHVTHVSVTYTCIKQRFVP